MGKISPQTKKCVEKHAISRPVSELAKSECSLSPASRPRWTGSHPEKNGLGLRSPGRPQTAPRDPCLASQHAPEEECCHSLKQQHKKTLDYGDEGQSQFGVGFLP